MQPNKMYYSDYYDYIPTGIVNKKLTGVGISSFALENNDPLVLVVPNVSMIQNKTAQYPNSRRNDTILGFYSGQTINVLKDYLKHTLVPKVMVTYDSFYKIIPYINKDFHIVVDEFSELLDAYGYRDKAINSLLDNVFQFPKLSFVSATPIKKEYLPSKLAELSYTELNWDNLVPVKVVPYNTTKPLTAVLNIIKKYKAGLANFYGHDSETAYFYVNSVKMIRQIIDKAGLLPSEVRIVCANTPENKKKLDIFDIETTLDPEKTFNFFTSSNFKGSDIYSDTGVAFVVSNNQNIHTLLTIDTDIYQIAGRIRNLNNPFRNLVHHIYNQNPLNMDEEAFSNYLNRKINDTNEMLKIFKTTEDNQKEIFLRNIKVNGEENFLHLTSNNELVFDEIKLLQEKRVYECVIKIYQSGLNILNAYKENNFEVIENDIEFNSLGFLVGNEFKSVCKLVCEGKCNKEKVFKQFSLIEEAYTKLGAKRLKALGYDSYKIKNELNVLAAKDNIDLEIKKLFETDIFYSNKDIKAKLSNLYTNLGINKKAKATDIEEVFNISVINKKINGKTVRGYQL